MVLRRTALLAIAFAVVLAACDETPREPAPSPAPPAAESSRVPRPDSQTVTLQTHEAVMKYDVRSGVVEYVNERLGRRQTYFFDNYGAQEAVYTTGNDGDSVSTPFDVSIYTGAWRFDYNSRDRTGIAKNQPNERGAVLGLIEDLRTVSITPIEGRTIAGRRTSGISYRRNGIVRVWLWRGLPLRLERPLRGGDTLVLEATSVRADEKIPAERFVVPTDVSISRLR